MTIKHGGNIYGRENMLDFSANINPLGMPESVKKAIIDSASLCAVYPDHDCTLLAEKTAEHENVTQKQIVFGNGAADLIYRIVYALRPKKAAICAPAFSEYKKALNEIGCNITEYMLKEDRGFVLDELFLDVLAKDTDMIFLCTPNNPTGKLIPPHILRGIAERCLQNGITLVCDECFLGFAENGEKYSLKNYFYENCIILKAFTKLYAIPGIRLGYAVFKNNAFAEKIKTTGQYWSVSVPAQAAGIAALEEKNYVEKTVSYIAEERRFLTEELLKTGVKVYEADANFILIKTFEGLDKKLEKHGIIIRDCSEFEGLCGGYFRIAVRTHAENLRLIQAVGRCIYE